MVWFQYHCNPPDLFYPSDSQWNTFFVPHPCLLPLTCSLHRGWEINQFEVCSDISSRLPNGPSAKWHYQKSCVSWSCSAFAEYRAMTTRDRPFPAPFQQTCEPTHLIWSITSPLKTLFEFLECALSFYLLPSNLFCSGSAFISFLLEPSKFLALKTIINIFYLGWHFHSAHKSIAWHPPAAKIPRKKSTVDLRS